MGEENIISVENVGKKFRLYRSGTRTVKSAVLDLVAFRGRRRDFWALKDVTFSVRKGETLGIIGANGAGKSTLLSLIAGTKVPTEGAIRTQGSISCLLELGAGFHPDLTGRENIFLAGAIMGLSRRQMRERFDAIVAFAEMAEFIDQPVKHYSSGMYVRLGFAVAVEVDPDIMLIDEVIAVGDVSFQRKCLKKMAEFRKAGKTMLIISHDLSAIRAISDRILILNEGKVIGLGNPEQMVESYQSLSLKSTTVEVGKEWGTGEVRITAVDFFNDKGQPTNAFNSGAGLEARLTYEAKGRIVQPVFGFAVADTAGRILYGNNTQIEGVDIPFIEGKGILSLHLQKLSLARGTYLFSFSVHSADHKVNYHRLENRFPIAVESDKPFEGCYMPCAWKVGSP